MNQILERDNYLCGIHTEGCEKKITVEEATVDHIVPKNIIKTVPRKDQNKFYRGSLNLQPMCRNCNKKKEGIFLPDTY